LLHLRHGPCRPSKQASYPSRLPTQGHDTAHGEDKCLCSYVGPRIWRGIWVDRAVLVPWVWPPRQVALRHAPVGQLARATRLLVQPLRTTARVPPRHDED
jgi:hypothetical protein